MRGILSELEIEMYRLSVVPDLTPKARALIIAAGAVQSGKCTLEEAKGLLMNPNFEGLNMPTESGAAAGKMLANLFGDAEACCKSCAYRAGTIPNQCPSTIMDALECASTGEPFYCHNTGQPCEGWKATQKAKL